jgi:hypothetical protein
MMNKDDERYESTVSGSRRGIEIIDTTDDEKPAANVSEMQQPGNAASNPLVVVKRKRKSPDKPWKKPPDMPKRPLSAYNLFFRDERERILGAGSEVAKQSDETSGAVEAKSGGKKVKSKSGIGFSNLAKTIANKWNELDKDIRAPYEEIAAAEKKKYDELVAEWRVKEAAKKKALALAKKEAGEEQKTVARTTTNLYPSDRSLGSFSDTSNPYPTEWFHSGPEHDTTEREDTSTARSSVPTIVDMAPGMSYDSRMHGSSMPGHGWHHGRHDTPSSYYPYPGSGYDASGSHMRYSPDTERPVYSFPVDDSRTSVPHDFSPVYRDYYHHSQQSMYAQQSSRRISDMRMSRAASLPASRHDDMAIPHQTTGRAMLESPEELELSFQQEMERNAAHMRVSRSRQFRSQYSASTSRDGSTSYPRSSSMPYTGMQHQFSSSGNRRRRIHPVDFTDQMGPPPPRYDETQDESYRSLPPAYGRPQMMHESTLSRRHGPPQINLDTGVREVEVAAPMVMTAEILPPGQGQPLSSAAATNESTIVQTSLQSLNETLDEDAISFITAMKYP